MREFINIVESTKILTVYRGEYSGNRGGKFWTQDRDFARQFTQSGRDTEILVRYIYKSDIKDCSHIYAGDPDAVEAVALEAKEDGFKAVMLNEGRGEPNSIWVFDRSALRRSIVETTMVESTNTAQAKWFLVSIAAHRGDQHPSTFGLTVQADNEEEASRVALRKFADKWGEGISTEVTKVEPTDEPKAAAPVKAPKPKPKKIKPILVNKTRIKDGRSILPSPANGEKWEPVGKPFLIDIDQLDFHPDGLGTAYSAFYWSDKAGSELPTSDKPVSVTMVDGQYHVLDGYHRAVKAQRHGHSQVMVQALA